MNFFKKIFGKKGSLKTWRELTEYFVDYLAKNLNNDIRWTKITWGKSPDQTIVHSKNAEGFEYNSYMGNYFAEYSKDPRNLEAITQYWAGLILNAMQSDNSVTSENIMPIVKNQDWLSTSQQQLKALYGDQPFIETRILQALTDDLYIAYVIDKPNSMTYVSESDLKELNLTKDELFKVAIANLKEKISEVNIQGSGGRYALRFDQAYDSSFALVIDHFVKLCEVSNPVIAIPERGELLLCSADNIENVTGLKDMTQKIFDQATYPISPKLYLVSNTTDWQILK